LTRTLPIWAQRLDALATGSWTRSQLFIVNESFFG
jgi:hypothetical protein